MKWLITGGCGFIGTSLIRSLVEDKEHSIRVVDNLTVGTRDDLASVCEFKEIATCLLGSNGDLTDTEPNLVDLVVGDIRNEQLALDVAKGMDVIVHLAANTGVYPSVENPRLDCECNVIGTLNYLEAARCHHIERFVFASSGAPVGECTPPIHEEMPPHPVSPYGASKLACEGYCSAYFRTYGIETVALRFGNVYGPGSRHKSSVVAKFIQQAIRGERLDVYGDGTQTRDFIYVDDLVRAVCLAAEVKGIGGEIFQIATNCEVTVNQLIDHLSGALALAGLTALDVSYAAPRLGDVKQNYSDTSKARRILHWTSQTDLPTGLASTVQWFLRESAADPNAQLRSQPGFYTR